MKESLSRTLRWLRRIRHRQGYGIHSPFAFNLVTGVIYEKGQYYAYARLYRLFRRQRHTLRWKDYRLLFRLANFQHARHALLCGLTQADLAYACLEAGSRHTEYTCGEANSPGNARLYDLIVASDDWENCAANLLPRLREGGMLILIGINTPRRREAWQSLLEAAEAQVSFDLYDFGLICYRPELQREHYLINYR